MVLTVCPGTALSPVPIYKLKNRDAKSLVTLGSHSYNLKPGTLALKVLHLGRSSSHCFPSVLKIFKLVSQVSG